MPTLRVIFLIADIQVFVEGAGGISDPTLLLEVINNSVYGIAAVCNE